MLRKDREITDFGEIVKILDSLKVLRIGIFGEEYPYIVPVSFGYLVKDGVITIYFHGAKRGLKSDLIAINSKVCVEGDTFFKFEKTLKGITAKYESIIAFGNAEKIEEEAERVFALNAITAHCGYPDYVVSTCVGFNSAAIYKITVSDITAKRNPISE